MILPVNEYLFEMQISKCKFVLRKLTKAQAKNYAVMYGLPDVVNFDRGSYHLGYYERDTRKPTSFMSGMNCAYLFFCSSIYFFIVSSDICPIVST
jgi:hypothetical protein